MTTPHHVPFLTKVERPSLGIGVPLRHLLLVELERAGAAGLSLTALRHAVEARGFRLEGHAGKTLSGALRTELRRGRVTRIRRGHYALGELPRTTRWRAHNTVRALVGGEPLAEVPEAVGRPAATNDQ